MLNVVTWIFLITLALLLSGGDIHIAATSIVYVLQLQVRADH